jgi:hypothetical protein
MKPEKGGMPAKLRKSTKLPKVKIKFFLCMPIKSEKKMKFSLGKVNKLAHNSIVVIT